MAFIEVIMQEIWFVSIKSLFSICFGFPLDSFRTPDGECDLFEYCLIQTPNPSSLCCRFGI